MAERRMFSIKIIDSDEFLDLPLEAQSLYFHLAMRADDDGFVNSSRRLVRTIGASQDDFKILVDKRFIILFDSGVVAIRHWKVHNQIKKDRYKETIFFEEKRQLTCDENGAYIHPKYRVKAVDPSWNQSGTKMDPNWIQTGTKVDPQYSVDKYSIDKDSLGKGSIEEERIEKINLREGSINTPSAPCRQNKYEEDFSSDWAVAPLPTEEDFLEEQPCLNEIQLYQTDCDEYIPDVFDICSLRVGDREGREVLHNDVMHGINDELRNDVDLRSNDVALRANVAFGKKENHPEVDEVLSGKSDETTYIAQDMRSEGADNTTLKPIGGPYGRGIVHLTDGQLADLKERLGEPQLNRYMDKLASFISSRGARIKSHYDTIIKWYDEDCKNQNVAIVHTYDAPSYPKPARYQPEKTRYGDFDTAEAFRHALERTRREYEKELALEECDD